MQTTDQQSSPTPSHSKVKWRQRHRILWIIGLLISGILGLSVAAVAGLLVYVNTQSGQTYLAKQIGSLTSHTVEVEGLSGSFPNHLRVADIKLVDPKIGVWLELKNTQLDWSLWALVKKEIHVDRLYAQNISVYDLPPTTDSPETSSSSSSLPNMVVAANINDIQIDQLFVSDKISPIDISVGIKGKVEIKNVLRVAGVKSLNDLSNINLALHLWELNKATDLQLLADIGDSNINNSSLHIDVQRESKGLVERLLKTDQLTPMKLTVSMKGPFNKLASQLNLTAAKMHLEGSGDIDLNDAKMNIALAGNSPATALNSTMGWGGWDINAKLHGDFAAPIGAGKFVMSDFAAGDVMVNKLSLQFKGQDASTSQDKNAAFNPWVRLNLVADGLRIPGSKPKLLADSPLSLDLLYHPKEKDESLDIQLDHQLIKMTGRVFIKPALQGSLDLFVPQLYPLAQVGNVDIKGSTVFNIAFALPERNENPIQVDLDGPIQITGGLPIAVKTIGAGGHIGLHANIIQGKEQNIVLKSLVFTGKKITIDSKGSLVGNQVKGLLNLSLNDLSSLASMLKGETTAQITLGGSLQDLSAKLALDTTLSTLAKSGYALSPSHLKLNADLQHIPSEPNAVVSLTGDLDKTPIGMQLQAGLLKDQNKYFLKLPKFEWRGVQALADIELPLHKLFPIGMIKLDVNKLSDIGKLVNQKIDGNVHLDIHTVSNQKPRVMIDLKSQVSMPQAKVGKMTLSGYVDNPIERPDINIKLQANQIQVPKIVQGNVNLGVIGSLDNLKITANGQFPSLIDSKGNLDTALLLNLSKKQVNVQKFNVLVKGETIRLLSPVQADFGDKLGVNRLRMSVAPVGSPTAIIDIAGTVKPKLALNATVRNITPTLAKPFVPDLRAKGVINAQAKLQGTIEKPQGSVRINGRDLQLLNDTMASFPPAQLNAEANLSGDTAKVNTQLQVGKKISAQVSGSVPIQSQKHFALQVNGNIDLSVANAIVGAAAQQVTGLVNIAMQVGGTLSAPTISGQINLNKGSFRDYAQGVNIKSIQASIQGQRDSIVLQSFSAKAGDGDMNASGKVGIFQPGLPIDIHFMMKNAKPLVSDLLTAILDGDITLKGMAKSRIDVGGIVKIKHAEINIPHSMARSVVPLKVIRPGDKVEASTQSSGTGPKIGLNLTIKTAGQILVRGFGLFTDMAGSLHIGGTADAPQINGGFAMQNGHIDLAGISLDFTKGVIGFKGSNVDHKIDPSLDFEIKKSVEGNTVKLAITGYASAPKISLSSSPPLSQDRVLAMLLFGVDSQSLSTTQMAEIGVALATIGGEGSGFDPIGTVRKTLGLDRLSVGGGSNDSSKGASTGTSVSAGKYVMKGVYLGAKQSTGAAGTQAEVQVDITKRLKATATVGTGQDRSGFITPDNDPGSSIGLLYKFDY